MTKQWLFSPVFTFNSPDLFKDAGDLCTIIFEKPNILCLESPQFPKSIIPYRLSPTHPPPFKYSTIKAAEQKRRSGRRRALAALSSRLLEDFLNFSPGSLSSLHTASPSPRVGCSEDSKAPVQAILSYFKYLCSKHFKYI